jgi:hypothetical protein
MRSGAPQPGAHCVSAALPAGRMGHLAGCSGRQTTEKNGWARQQRSGRGRQQCVSAAVGRDHGGASTRAAANGSQSVSQSVRQSVRQAGSQAGRQAGRQAGGGGPGGGGRPQAHQGSRATAAANSGWREAASAAVAPPQEWPHIVSFDRSMAPFVWGMGEEQAGSSEERAGGGGSDAAGGQAGAALPPRTARTSLRAHLELLRPAACQAEGARRRAPCGAGGGRRRARARVEQAGARGIPERPQCRLPPHPGAREGRGAPSLRERRTSTAAITSSTLYSHLACSTGPVPRPANMRQLPSASCAAPWGDVAGGGGAGRGGRSRWLEGRVAKEALQRARSAPA